ncbi:hypothetical protein [Parvibaculum sp.]|uniref:hypothetical protein n=1 Tax=Parvibaculum sp. TaxID=2024848 RepID=UPI003BAA8C92
MARVGRALGHDEALARPQRRRLLLELLNARTKRHHVRSVPAVVAVVAVIGVTG